MVSGKAIFSRLSKASCCSRKNNCNSYISTYDYTKKIEILSNSDENLMPIHLKFIFFHGFLPFPSLRKFP